MSAKVFQDEVTVAKTHGGGEWRRVRDSERRGKGGGSSGRGVRMVPESRLSRIIPQRQADAEATESKVTACLPVFLEKRNTVLCI